MSNDLMTDLEAGEGLEARATVVLEDDLAITRRPWSGAPDALPPVPFADAEQAGAVVASCRRLLARTIDPDDVVPGTFTVLTAKVLDETGAFGDGCPPFAPVDAEPRVSASNFDALVRAARAALAAHGPDPGTVEVPEVVAHEVLRRLGAHSITETAARTGGRAIVTAAFAASFAGVDDGIAPALARALGATLADTPLASVRALGAVASAAATAAEPTR